MKSVYLNTYENIILGSILEFEGDLIQLRNYLKIFSKDFVTIYDYIYAYYERYSALPSIDILKTVFSGYNIKKGNSGWALDEQVKFYIKQEYKDVLLNMVEELEKRDFSHSKIKDIVASTENIGLTFNENQDHKDLQEYLRYKTKIIPDLAMFSLWLGRGIEIPSFNMVFANTHGGKTMFSYKFTAELFKLGKKVLFLSPEMNWKKSILEIYSYVKEKPIDVKRGISVKAFHSILKYITVPPERITDVKSYIQSNYRNYDYIILDSYYEFAQGSEGAGDDNGKMNDLTSFLVALPKPVFVTTQAKPYVTGKKLSEVTLYDTYYNTKGSVAGDYVGFVRFDKGRGVLEMIHLKGRNADYKAQLEDETLFNIGYHNGVFAEVGRSQNKFI